MSIGYRKLLEDSRKLYDTGFTGLADRPFHRAGFMARQAPSLLRLGAWRSVWQMVARRIRNDHLRQTFSIQPLLVGGNPFDTTCIYGLIHFLERSNGVHFAMGGTGALIDALGNLMKVAGIGVRLGKTVERLSVHHDRIDRVHLCSGRDLVPDQVVSNVDPVHLYRNMLPASASKTSARLKSRHARQSMGLFVLYFGTRRQYPDVAHHTIWLGERYRELLDDIFNRKVLAEDFSIYLHRPTATDPSFAPAGCDSFYALVPVPNLGADIDWEREGPRLQERVVRALSDSLLPGLDQTICSDFFMTPKDFSSRYLATDGSGFSIAPTFRQSAWFRFHNHTEGPSNLYLVGAGTHPGAGIPEVLSSAKVFERLLIEAEQDRSIPWPATMGHG